MGSTAPAEAEEAKASARRRVEDREGALVELSHTIHSYPELCFEEERAAGWVGETLSGSGFAVEAGVCDLPTSLVATAGHGPLVVAICAEYDALPGIGHACGHNIIAAAAVGAGAALAPLADDLGMTVKVMGTPAEEGGGGKILMLQKGAFDGVNAAMMVHPAPVEMPCMDCLAVSHFDVRYEGRSAHASGFPEKGVNAADAITVSQVGIGLLRQQLRRGDQIHGIVTVGGDAPNVIPARTSARYMVRATTTRDLERLEPRVRRCFEAGALATGCELDIVSLSPVYSQFEPDDAMTAAFVRNAESLGREYPDLPEAKFGGSTDMANISLATPSIHPMLGIDSLPAVNHQPEFAAAAITPIADRAVVEGATAMAWTTIDLATDDTQRSRLTAKAVRAGGP